MFEKLIPYRKRDNQVKVMNDENNPIAQMRREFDDLFDRFLSDWDRGLSESASNGWLGAQYDLQDHENEYVLSLELPGFEPDDFDVKVSGNVLTLQAQHKDEGKQNNGSYRRYGSFYESMTLPQGIKADEIDARYHSGVLEVHLPKGEDVHSQRIEVQAV